MQNYDHLLIEKNGPIVNITLNRPDKLNALNDQLMYNLNDALDAIDRDESIRVVILNGAGRAFCSGYDITPREKPLETLQEWRDHAFRTGRQVIMKLWGLRTPVITAVHGYALGGGCDLVLASDLTIMTEDAKIGEPDVHMVSSPSTMLMPWVVGIKKAKELILTGEMIDAREAYRLEIANRIVPTSELYSEAWRLARQLAKIPPISTELNKRMINYAYEVMGIHNALTYGAELFSMLMMSPEAADFGRKIAKNGLKAALDERNK